MFGRKRRARERAEAAAATAPPEPAPEPTPAPAPAPELAWPAPVPEPAPELEPAPLRYFAEGVAPTEAVAEESEPESGPIFRFTPVDEPAPAQTAPDGADPTPTPVVRAEGTRLVARPDATRALAERMRESQHEMAQLSMHMDAWMDQAVQLRTELMVEWDADGVRPSDTDLVVRAVARALSRHPHLNSTVRDDSIELLTDIHVGITTSVDDDVSIDVVSHADRRSLKEIAASSRPDPVADADAADEPAPTFVVTSLGAYGVDAFTPVVLAPNVATLGIGRVRDETRWEGDRPVRASVMTLVLSWDHRAFGGVTAAEFLVEIREMLEQPYRLLVD